MPSSTAPIVEMVPARPMTVLAAWTPGTSRDRSSNQALASAMALLSSSGSGGSLVRCFSVSRTQPTSKLRTSSGSLVPTMHSVDPPPMSITRNGPSLGSKSAVAPAKLIRPSSSPLSSSGRVPTISSAGPKKSSLLLASRAALVAAIRTRSTCCSSIAAR